jgi:hypothetical protein
MAEKITIEKTTCGISMWGSKIKLVKGENIVDVDAWEAFKKLPHVAAKIESGELIEGESHSSETIGASVTPVPDVVDNALNDIEKNTDENPKPKSKRKRKKSS